jgi:hypothetical protein
VAIISVFVYTLISVLYWSNEIKILVLDTDRKEFTESGDSESESDLAWTWAVEGYTYYENLEQLATDYADRLDVSRLFQKRSEEDKPNGVWLLTTTTGGAQNKNRIRLSGFQFPDPSAKEVSVAMNVYLHGSGSYLQVNLRNAVTGSTDKFVITAQNYKNGFCNKIIPLKYSAFADQVS